MNANNYLTRINYTGDTTPTLQNLHQLQRAHLMNVPFENLDIHEKRPIILDRANIYRKVVDNQRGGFCFELNGLFAWLLAELGYDVEMLTARVVTKEQSLGHPYDHLTLAVTLGEQKWLVDVGFGHFYNHPIHIALDQLQTFDNQSYLIRKQSPYLMLNFREGEGEWKGQFAFTEMPQPFEAFEEGCSYHQTSPESHFTQGRICSLPLPNGRISLTDELLIETKDGVRTETAVEDHNHFRQLLKTHFSIELNQITDF